MTTKDMMTTLSLIHDFWPDFSITKEDLQSPTTDFVIKFFTNFLAEINETVACLTNEESANEGFDSAVDFGREVSLFCRLSKILKKMNYTSFNLNDIYSPQSKRIHAAIKYCIHFLIYVNNSLDDISNTCNDIYKKVTQCEDLSNLKQQCLQDSAENAENLARAENTQEGLKKKLDAIKKRHEKMLQDKVAKETIFFEKSTEVSNLRNANDNLDYELYDLEGREKELQERVVTEEDFDSLKNSVKYLEMEQAQVCEEIAAIDRELDEQVEVIEYVEDYAKDLRNLDFNALNVDILSGLEKEEKSLQNINKELNNELKMLNDDKINKEDRLKKKMQAEEEGKKLLSNVQAKTALDLEECKKLYERKIAQYSADLEESQRLKTEIVCAQESIAKIEEEEKELKNFAVNKYKKILDSSTTSTKKMNSMLLKLKNQK